MSDHDPAPRGRRKALVAAGVAATLIVGGFAVTKSLALALSVRNPDAALRVDPGNSIALGLIALRDIQVARTPAERDAAAALALRAIRRDAANATALSALGLSRVDPSAAGRAFAASEALSRRSLLTQLALIESSVARDDVDGALRHYDTALRTSNGSASILFPVLVEATGDRALLSALARKLAQRPSWGELYLIQLAQSGTALNNVAALFATLLSVGVDPGPTATPILYARLIEQQAYDDAWQVYAGARKSARRAGVRNGNFNAVPDLPAPFDWNLNNDGTVVADIRLPERGEDGRLGFTSTIGQGGLVARQLVLLPPGARTVRARAYGVTAPEDARPYLRLDCATTNAELGREPLTPFGRADGNVELRVTVPRGCGAQWLSVMVQPPANSEVIEGSVGSVTAG